MLGVLSAGVFVRALELSQSGPSSVASPRSSIEKFEGKGISPSHGTDQTGATRHNAQKCIEGSGTFAGLVQECTYPSLPPSRTSLGTCRSQFGASILPPDNAVA